MQALLEKLIANPLLHAKWLNTLSMMENAGARKISACEDKNNVTLTVLKHAAEEHRHAFYLKKQIAKIDDTLCPNYHLTNLLAPKESKFYLDHLDIAVSRFLRKALSMSNGWDLKFSAYILVTYAIEVRAESLYPQYQAALENAGSNIHVKSIIVEEMGHLAEMRKQINQLWKHQPEVPQKALELESQLFQQWTTAVSREVLTS